MTPAPGAEGARPLRNASPTVLATLVRERRLLVCVGAGGVGKTTTAASMALRAALEGRRVLVLTIDPARRLANALGLDALESREVRIDLGTRAAPGGELWAMMLDPRATLDDVVSRLAPTPALRDALFRNRVYRHIAGSFSGSQEYMAAERLHDVVLSGRYDLVVLDTPPVKNALDFLESPGRMTRFLDRQVIKWFLAQEQGGVGRRLLAGTSAVVHGMLGHVFGKEFLGELTSFFTLFGDMVDGFRERHEAVGRMFHDSRTAFVVVTAPTDSAVDVATFFLEELRARRMPLAAVVLNQVHTASADVPDVEALVGTRARALDPVVAPSLVALLTESHARLRERVRGESRRAEVLRAAAGVSVPLVPVPRVRGEVHDLDALASLHGPLFGAERSA